jgi:hypothetical protein
MELIPPRARAQPPSSAMKPAEPSRAAEPSPDIPLFLRGPRAPRPAFGGDEGAVTVQPKLAVAGSSSPLEEQADHIAARASTASPTSVAPTPPPAQATPNRLTGTSGEPLSGGLRQRVEPLLGIDLGRVRVHDAPADRSAAAAIRARAFTHQDHIFLGGGESAEDVSLMAHELTHVAQQTQQGGAPSVQRKPAAYRHPEDGAAPHARLMREIEEEVGDEAPPKERPELDRADVSAKKGRLQPSARPDVDRPALEQPGVASAASQAKAKVDEPAEEGTGGKKKGAGKGAGGEGAVGDAEAAAAQAAFDAAAAEPATQLPAQVAPVEHVAPVDAAGKAIQPLPNADAAVAEIAEAAQGMRDEGTGLQETASAERANARVLEGNVNLVGKGIALSELGTTTSQTHTAFRAGVVEQGRAALAVSREKTAWVAESAPQHMEKADAGREDSEGMAEESSSLSADANETAPDDEEAAERSREQSGEIDGAGRDVGNLDRAFSGSQQRARGLSADAARATELNTQAESKITESADTLQRTEERLSLMRTQTDEARVQLGGLSAGPAAMLNDANDTEAEGRQVVEQSFVVEERLRLEQQTHRANTAAIREETPDEIAERVAAGDEPELRVETLPPVLPTPAQAEVMEGAELSGGAAGGRAGGVAKEAGGATPAKGDAAASAAAGPSGSAQQPGSGEPAPLPVALPGEVSGEAAAGPPPLVQRVPQSGYEDRYDVDLSSPIAGAIPQLLGGTAPAEGEPRVSREEQIAAEEQRRHDQIDEIQAMASKPFEQLSSWERRKIALRMMGRNLLGGLGRIKFPGWGALALGLINPVTPLLGVVSGFSLLASGVANAFNIEAWRRDWLGNLLKTAADIATGLTVILGSITALATVIAALCTALIICTFGFLSPALGPVVAFCANVMVVVGGWTIAVGKWALLLQFLCFLKNLYEAGVARNATELQRASDRMTSDVSAAGNVVLQMGMAKLSQIGGRGMQASITRAGGGVRWAGGLTTRVSQGARSLGRALVRPGKFSRMASALEGGAARAGSSVRSGLSSAAEAVTAAPARLVGAARSLPSRFVGAARALPGQVVGAGRAASGAVRAIPGAVQAIPGAVSSVPRRIAEWFARNRGYLVGESVAPGWGGRAAAAAQGRTAAQMEAAILALRTETGAVDAAARARLLASLPEVVAGTEAEVRALASATLGVPSEQLSVRLVETAAGQVGQRGASGARVYLIFLEQPGQARQLISVVKNFPSSVEGQIDVFAGELSALQRLNQEILPNQGAARTMAAGRTAAGDAVLVMTAARGTAIDDLLIQLGAFAREQAALSGPALAASQAAERETFEILRSACRRNGEAIGTLHSSTRGASGATTFATHTEGARDIMRQLPPLVEARPGLAPVDFGAASDRLQQLIAGIERNPGAASVVHGDFHPGNVFYDAASGRVTFIDAARVHQSIGAAGNPIASSARDVASFHATLELFGGQYGVSGSRVSALQSAFMEGYASTAAANAFTPEALAFYRARFVLGQYIEALKTGSSRVAGADALFRSVLLP